MADGRATNGVDKKIGTRLRCRRIEIGLSQERLADLLGVSFQQVQKYEKGANRIAASRLFQICDATKTPLSYFYSDVLDDGGGASSTIEQAIETPEGRRLIALFGSISSVKVRRRLVGLAEAIANDDD